MVKVLSLDPGETTGWAYQDEHCEYPGGLLDIGQIGGIKELAVWLEAFTRPVDVVVIEDYKVWKGKRGAKSNTGSNLPTVRTIGVIESWALRNGIKIVKYPSYDADVIARKVGVNPRDGAHRDTHWVFAANYGRWYLIQQGLVMSALQLEMAKKGVIADGW